MSCVIPDKEVLFQKRAHEALAEFPALHKAEIIPGGVTFPQGWLAAGVSCGIKKQGLDLALLYSEEPALAAGAFTRNRFAAAPVQITRRRLAGAPVRAVVVNSGNANACTGPEGLEDALRTCEVVAEQLGVPAESVLVASTGVIGQRLPLERLLTGCRRAVGQLGKDGGAAAARAIMTTDTHPKEVALRVPLSIGPVSFGAMAKGSGMIHPDMATLLAFVTSDAPAELQEWQRWVQAAVDDTFNMISVDGDTSTNDMVLAMTNQRAGQGGATELTDKDKELLREALYYVCLVLAQGLAADGEGATRLVEVCVSGAAQAEHARRLARTISCSNLVKTAVFGTDANWGRIVCAAGYSGVPFDPEKVDVYVGSQQVAAGGRPCPFDEALASRELAASKVRLAVDLGLGPYRARAWTCDLTYDYVKINASYRS